MEATQTARHKQDVTPPTFETVWAALQETDRIVKENAELQKETDRLVKEYAREAKEQREDFNRRFGDFNKRFGDFTNRFGEVVEYMIAPNLQEKFLKLGFKFNETMTDRVFADKDNNMFFEVDVVLQNGEKALLVEIKTKLATEDIKEHIQRLAKMRAYADVHGDKHVFLGAVAGVVMTPQAKKYALKQGLYVIEPSGETLSITEPSGQPKEW